MDEEQGCVTCCHILREDIRSVGRSAGGCTSGSCCKDACSPAAVKRKLPILQWLPSYRLPHFYGDVIAGLTVGLTVIPQGLAYAAIAELHPQYGLYSAFMGCFIYCFMGTSKDITLGPTAIMSLMTAAFATSPILHDPTIAIVLTLSCGVVQFLMGLLHIGFIVEFISYPVISGFTTAAAITIACGQIKKLLGLGHIPRDFIPQIIAIFKHIKETRIGDLVLGLTVMVILVIMKAMKTHIEKRTNTADVMNTCKKVLFKVLWLLGTARNALVILLASLVVYAFDKNGDKWFTLTDSITPGLPPFSPPHFHINGSGVNGTTIELGPADIFKKIGTGLIIVPVLGLVEAIAIGKAFARKNNYIIDANQELLAIGLANIVSCFVSSYPVTGSFSRTAVNSQSGVMTPAGGIVTGSIVLLALGLLAEFFKYIPQSALAALIIVAVLDMVDFKVVIKFWIVKKIDVIPWFTTFLLSFLLGIEYGILVGIAVSMLLLLYPWARPSIVIEDEYYGQQLSPGDTAASTTAAPGQPSSSVKVIHVGAGLSYPGIEYLKQKVMDACNEQEDPSPKKVVLDLGQVFCLDYTAAQGLSQLVTDLNAKHISVALCHVQADVLAVIEHSSLRNLPLCEDNEEAVCLLNTTGPHEAANDTSHPASEPTSDPRASLLARNYGTIQPNNSNTIEGNIQNQHA